MQNHPVHSASTESEVTAKAEGIGMIEAWAFVKWALENHPQVIFQLALEYDQDKSAWINRTIK